MICGASFRDPAGYVLRDSGVYKRVVTFRGKADYDLLVSSGLYEDLTERRLLVRHDEEAVSPREFPGLYKLVVPEQIRHPSYYYEWSFGQLRDAALLTLQVQALALRHGMSLKDASAFNVHFRGPEPVFIDTLSFEANRGGPWVAYGQFCTNFLGPLALMSRVSLKLQALLRTSLDGIPLDLASRLLPYSTFMRPGLLLHLHLHARSIRKHSAVGRASRCRLPDPGGRDPKHAIVDSLEGIVSRLRPPRIATEWLDYYGESTHYTSQAESFKRDIVGRAIARVKPDLVYDLGGNTGRYSRVATQQGIDVVCYDVDPLCVHENYTRSRIDRDSHMLPLLCDLTNPSPALGFGLEERLSFYERSRPQLVLALALVHHLRFTGNVPLDRIARFLARIGEWLLIEFVPREDPLAAALVGNRPDVFHEYTEEQFRDLFGRQFATEFSVRIPDTCRTIYLFRRSAG